MVQRQKQARGQKWKGPKRGAPSASDYTVWCRAASHYGIMAKNDGRPGIRLWAAGRAAECEARANAALNG